MIELNDTLQISTEQGFPSELDYEKHLKTPFTEKDFADKVFSFSNKKNIRIFHTPPVRAFLAHNVDGKWLYWGQVEIVELTLNCKDQTTSGKFVITKIFTPEEMKQAEQILNNNKAINYFAKGGEEIRKDQPELFSTTDAIRFKYTNWKGETGIRTVKPIKLWFGTTEFHKGHHWFLKAFDVDKQAERDYAIEDIIKIYPIYEPQRIDTAQDISNKAISKENIV